ncbi:MAG: NapC/NirT family cytochrome c [Gammaproteobacteria bacterium]
MKYLRAAAAWIWRPLNRPAAHLSLGVLAGGGFIMGVLFWGGFNTALEWTNTEKFCVSCHEMRNNVYAELKRTIHYSNRSGVRATCPDCHVPHQWGDKIARKVKATKEVWGWVFGVVDTREKFEAHRLAMAEREWRRMENNDSLECRNCHDFQSMDFTLQKPRAAAAHRLGLEEEGKTCISCHKGIAHELPDPGANPVAGQNGFSHAWQFSSANRPQRE